MRLVLTYSLKRKEMNKKQFIFLSVIVLLSTFSLAQITSWITGKPASEILVWTCLFIALVLALVGLCILFTAVILTVYDYLGKENKENDS